MSFRPEWIQRRVLLIGAAILLMYGLCAAPYRPWLDNTHVWPTPRGNLFRGRHASDSTSYVVDAKRFAAEGMFILAVTGLVAIAFGRGRKEP